MPLLELCSLCPRTALSFGDKMVSCLRLTLVGRVKPSGPGCCVPLPSQGAGGNGNVLKEIVEPAGATYDIRKVHRYSSERTVAAAAGES